MKHGVAVVGSFLGGLLVLPVFVALYLAYGRPPVATADAPFPFEARIVQLPLEARIHREMPSTAPVSVTPDTLAAGAQVYRNECVACHGAPGKPSSFARTMFPEAPQLWAKHKSGVVGVSDDPVGETYWKVRNGIRLSGMPAYGPVISDTEIWQVSLLLSVADKPLSTEVMTTLAP
ncbi:Cytochrome c, mono-and diheme variants [Granulicella pectinivorans]|uniref:Cytochrome c, mono-and diheme variants n=1 Tax=Granulicella pectinivorans TaxID=474950 RepID=A0A1I6MLR8_9BACT|nr:cytochrome c [Granulicella pectinivorans]SFS16676.1 Cytochrome c, mono-and diheme variants [Granulicella pectinivorans]